MNLPNKLTILRIALIPVFVTLFFLPFPYMRLAALGVFALASLTDMLDGRIARKNNLVTELGKFLDPIADKMLVICALTALCAAETVFPPNFAAFGAMAVTVSTMIVVCRELAVSAFRIIAAVKGVNLAADKLGKIKTVLQMAALLILIPTGDLLFGAGTAFRGAMEIVSAVGLSVLLSATVMTLVSGINYIVKNRAVLSERDGNKHKENYTEQNRTEEGTKDEK